MFVLFLVYPGPNLLQEYNGFSISYLLNSIEFLIRNQSLQTFKWSIMTLDYHPIVVIAELMCESSTGTSVVCIHISFPLPFHSIVLIEQCNYIEC